MTHQSQMKKRPVWYLAAGFLALGLSACGCSTDSAVQKILGVHVEPPVFLAVKPTAQREIQFSFSQPVRVSSLAFSPPLEVEAITPGAQVTVTLKDTPAGGARFVADMLVEDEHGSTLEIVAPLWTLNDRLPRLLITELRTEYSSPKAEFVELKALGDGNLGALRLFIAGSSLEEPVFEFPPVEAAPGEYVVVHLRTLDPDSQDETGKDLALSPGTEALSEARDFWVPGAVKRLRKTDAVFLLDQQDRVLDAVLLNEAPEGGWKKEALAKGADFLQSQAAWSGGAVFSKGATVTRTVCRDESSPDTGTAADWYIAATSQATPGRPNSTKRYE